MQQRCKGYVTLVLLNETYSIKYMFVVMVYQKIRVRYNLITSFAILNISTTYELAFFMSHIQNLSKRNSVYIQATVVFKKKWEIHWIFLLLLLLIYLFSEAVTIFLYRDSKKSQ